MPDWLTHSLVGWITGKTTKQEISLIVLGSLLPDIDKLYLVFNWILSIRTEAFFLPLHTPVGAVLVACVVALFFRSIKQALLPLVIGIATHFVVDVIFFEVGGGVHVLFPMSWETWQLDLIPATDYDYMITIYAIVASILIYFLYALYKKKNVKPN